MASDNWRCRQRPVPGRNGAYAYSALAYDHWSHALEHASDLPAPLAHKLCFVSWFCFAALVDARSAAATFLNQAADDFDDDIATLLRSAAAAYAASCGALRPAIEQRNAFLPPWGDPGIAGWDDAARSRERTILEKVRASDATAERAVDAVVAAVGG